MASFIDISDRKQAEEKLLTSQLQLAEAADMARIAYWEYDEATTAFIFNDAFYDLFGTTAEREGGYRMTREEHLRRFVHPDDLEDLRRHVDETRARPRTGDIERYEHRAIRGDGEVVHILTRSRVVLDSKGRVLKVVGVNQDITRRKMMEEALRESEERYRTLFENSLDGIMLTQPDGTILAANRHACEMLRMTEEEIIRAGRAGVVVDDERLRAAVAERAKTGKWHGELTFRRLDGSNFPVEISSRVFAGPDGREMTAMVLRDNSERKLAEQALHEAEDKYRSLFSEMAYGAALHEVVTDSEGHAVDYVTLEVNGAFESLLGCRKEAVTGKRASDILPPDELRHWLDIFGPVALLGTSCHYEVYSPLNNKHFEGTAYSPGEGKFAVVFSDVTDRKEAQNQLEEKEERFRKIFDESPLGIVIVGSDHRFARANAAFCRMLGYTEEELIKLTFKDVTHPDHIAQDTLHVNQLVSGEIPLYRTEKRYVRKDKEIVWGSSTITIVHDESGNFLYFLTMVENITQRKQAEGEKTTLEDQLRQAQKMEAVGTLAGGVAHDFNNILTVILGLGNLMQMEIDKDDINRAYIDQIVASSERAADLTQSLLAFSRKQRIAPEAHTVNEVVTTTAKLLTRLLPEDIGLKMNLSNEGTSSLLDVSQIGQVLMNLATNARDAMPHGGSFTIATERVKIDEDFKKTHGFGRIGEYVRLSVSDTGTGMDEPTMKRIFEPFFTTKEVGKGTGLGLASAYGIVKQHNGYITVSSAPFEGTTFDIYLPSLKRPSRKKARAKGEIKGGTETILIVEDDRDVRYVLRTILEGQGYTVIEAMDGDDAIKTYREYQEDIDLTILDVVMPGRNGNEILDDIARIDPSAKAIFVSGYTGDVVIDKGIQSENVDFLQKPLSIEALLAKVREVLGR